MDGKMLAAELVGVARELVADMVFDIGSVDEWGSKLYSGIRAPFVQVRRSTLGGDRNVSILIAVSVDEKRDWSNGYIENSRYFRMHLLNDGSLELFSGNIRPNKFRKTRVRSVEEALSKINGFVGLMKSTAPEGGI